MGNAHLHGQALGGGRGGERVYRKVEAKAHGEGGRADDHVAARVRARGAGARGRAVAGRCRCGGAVLGARTLGHRVAHNLDERDHDHEHHHGHVYYVELVAVLAVLDGEVAQAAGAHGSGHGGKVEQRDERHGGYARQARDGFAQVYAPDDVERSQAHGVGRLDEPGVNLGERHLNLAGEEWDGAHYERHDGARHADGGSHDEARNGEQRRQQDDERDGAKHVGHLVEHLPQRAVLQDAAGARDGERHAQHSAEHEHEHAGPREHEQRLPNGGDERVPLGHDVGNECGNVSEHQRSPRRERFRSGAGRQGRRPRGRACRKGWRRCRRWVHRPPPRRRRR